MPMKINIVCGVRAYPLLLLLCCVFPASPLAAAPADLILLVVVDQLRADMPERLHGRFEAALQLQSVGADMDGMGARAGGRLNL